MAKVGGAIGKGLIAGFAGTVAISISQMIEMKITNRDSSNTPVVVGGKVLGVEPRGKAKVERQKTEGKASPKALQDLQKNEQQFAQLMHFGYGTGWGIFRGALDLACINGKTADFALFGGIWTAAQLMLPAAAGSKPIYKWSPQEIGIDVLHHAVYAFAAGEVYEAMRKAEKVKKRKKKRFLFI